ncbi:MAG TPA: transcriptional repressor [Candidatus Saccharimonadales bacterium]|nr:transcriptional repressor [Candidatus Saccharimonadales bacterium]
MRLAKTKSEITKILSQTSMPLDAVSLTKKLNVNKTTIYRNLESLINENKVIEVEFGDNKKRYELTSHKHHHHIICKSCGKIKDLKSKKLEKEIDNLSSEIRDFLISNHELEFFGYCSNCKK